MKKKWSAAFIGMVISGIILTGATVWAGTVSSASEIEENLVEGYEESRQLPEGFAGENLANQEIVTGMDEEANIYVLDTEEITSLKQMGIAKFSNDGFFVNFNTKSSYDITEYADLGTGEEGYVCGKYGADALYLGMVNNQVKFMLAGAIGTVNADEVELVSKEDAASFSFYEVVNGNLIHRITTNMYETGYSNNLSNGPAPKYLKSGVEYYSYDGHYFYTDLDVMLKDYQDGIRDSAVNPEEPFFNYFQFLPFRSYSEYDSDELLELINSRISDKSKLKNLGDTFVEMQKNYGVNALLAAGVAANESSWGNSNIAQTKNNLFGINAVDATPGESSYYYKKAEDCVKDFTETMMSKQYFNPNNWKYRGAFLGNKASGVNLNYASDPYWGEKVAAIVWNLDGYGGKQDEYLYTIGIKDVVCSEHTNMNIRREPDQSAERIYRSKTQAGHAFLIIDPEPVNRYYKIQSEPVLTAGRNGIATGTGSYNKYSMYAYLSMDYVTIVSEGTKEDINKVTFKDVKETSWYYVPVEYVVENGIMTGLNYDYFGPYDVLERSQLPVMLYRLEREPEVEYTKKFTDVPDEKWYTDAILWANENGIVSGYTDSFYGVKDMITREQLAVMMHRYAVHKGYQVDEMAEITGFKDYDKIGSYAKTALSWAVGSGLILGKEDGKILDPKGVASRSETATVFMRFMDYYSETPEA